MMQNTFIIQETQLYGSSYFMLNVVSILSVFLGVYVIISKNPVISILFLIGLFFTVSIYLIMIGLHFIGLSYLLVYIGAVSIFFIFIIMLINIRVSELLTDNRNSIPLAILTVILFNYCISDVLPFGSFLYDIKNISLSLGLDNLLNIASNKSDSLYQDININLLHYLSLIDVTSVIGKSWDGLIIHSSHISSIGGILYTNLYILLIVISLILLLAMVGAIVITTGKTSK